MQRPSILDDIALDLYILRLIAPLQTRVSNAVNRVPTYPDDIALAKALLTWKRCAESGKDVVKCEIGRAHV